MMDTKLSLEMGGHPESRVTLDLSYASNNEFLIDGEWRRLGNSEFSLVLGICKKLPVPLTDPPSVTVPLSTLCSISNQSVSTVKRNKAILVQAGILSVRKNNRAYEPDTLVLCDPDTIPMRRKKAE